MTGQIPDFVLYHGEEYDLVGIDGRGLLSPHDFGLAPKSPHTACWRGFVMYYECKENRLTLQGMDVHSDAAPMINGAKPEERGESSFRYHYEGIDVEVPFTGTLILARDFIDEMYVHMGFQRPHAFKTVIELTVENGHILQSRELSSQMEEQRKQNPHKDAVPGSSREEDVMQWIKDRFSREGK
ncbi:hypothetical protein EU537_07345 [Candidatus Thorarchaeota archaeon]|nr:MAG: hypothetical protein EU537_07345 [Candidatus Thorarchaeota archaeon]